MNTQARERTLIIRPRRALYIFGGAGIVVLVLSFLSQYLRLFPYSYKIHFPFQANLIQDFISEFDFNGQPDISTYFNVVGLNLAAGLLFVIAYFKNAIKDVYRFHWAATAWIVLFFSIDSLAVVHKKILVLSQYVALVRGWSIITWVAVGIVALTVLFFRFWWHLDNQYRYLFLASAVLYIAGVLGKGLTGGYDSNNLVYSLILTIAQGLQYSGVILLIYSVLLYLPSFLSQFFVSTDGVAEGNGTLNYSG